MVLLDGNKILNVLILIKRRSRVPYIPVVLLTERQSHLEACAFAGFADNQDFTVVSRDDAV